MRMRMRTRFGWNADWKFTVTMGALLLAALAGCSGVSDSTRKDLDALRAEVEGLKSQLAGKGTELYAGAAAGARGKGREGVRGAVYRRRAGASGASGALAT